MNQLATTRNGDGCIEKRADGVYIVTGKTARSCSFEMFLSAVTKHGWEPKVSLDQAREIFEGDPEGYGMDEPPEQVAGERR